MSRLKILWICARSMESVKLIFLLVKKTKALTSIGNYTHGNF